MALVDNDREIQFTPTVVGANITNPSTNTFRVEYDTSSSGLFSDTASPAQNSGSYDNIQINDATLGLSQNLTRTCFVSPTATFLRIRILSGVCQGTTKTVGIPGVN